MAQIFGRNRRRGVVVGLIAVLMVVAFAGGFVLTGGLNSAPATGTGTPGSSGSGAIAGASGSIEATSSSSDPGASADASAGDSASPGDSTATETATDSGGGTATASSGATIAVSTPTVHSTYTPTHAPTPTVGPTPTPTKPDLAFVSVDAPTQRCGQPGHVTVRIANRGTAAASGEIQVSVVDTYSGIRTSASLYLLPTMEPGAERSFNHGLANELGCDLNHVFSVDIDPEDAIDESNEFNNFTTRTYHVDPMPDLSVTWVATNVDPTCSVHFTITAIVHNQGGLAMPRAAEVRFTDSYGGVAQRSNFETLPIIASGGNTTIHTHMILNTHCGQPHRMTVMVDSGYVIDESHEDNNTRYIDYRM